MFDIRNVAWLMGIDVSLSRSAFGVMWPRSKPEAKKSLARTRYHVGGTSGSGRKVSTRVSEPTHSSVRCQLTQFGRPRSRLYEIDISGFCIRKLFGFDRLVVALDGLPIVRWTLNGYGGAVPVATVNVHV